MEKSLVKSQRRKGLKLSDLKAICRLVATRRLTETEACLVLNINANQFFQWKQRQGRSEVASRLIERIKAQKIDTLLTDIEKIGDGIPELKMKPDWRCKEFVLKTVDKRFANQPSESAPTTNNLTVNLMSEALKRVFIEVEPVKQLTTTASKIPARRKDLA